MRVGTIDTNKLILGGVDVVAVILGVGPANNDKVVTQAYVDEAIDSVSDYLGYFTSSAALIAAYPSGDEGNFATVGDTDTIWVWDIEGAEWVDSHNTSNILWQRNNVLNILSPVNAGDNILIDGDAGFGIGTLPEARVHIYDNGGINQLKLDSISGAVGMKIYTQHANLLNRNWQLAIGDTEYGDIAFRVGLAFGNDPAGATGRTVAHMTRGGSVEILSQLGLIAYKYDADAISHILSADSITLDAPIDTAVLTAQPTVGGNPLAIATTQFVLDNAGGGGSSLWQRTAIAPFVLSPLTVGDSVAVEGGGAFNTESLNATNFSIGKSISNDLAYIYDVGADRHTFNGETTFEKNVLFEQRIQCFTGYSNQFEMKNTSSASLGTFLIENNMGVSRALKILKAGSAYAGTSFLDDFSGVPITEPNAACIAVAANDSLYFGVDNRAFLKLANDNLTIYSSLTVNSDADQAKLANQPTGADDLAIATTKYVDDNAGGGSSLWALNANALSPAVVGQTVDIQATLDDTEQVMLNISSSKSSANTEGFKVRCVEDGAKIQLYGYNYARIDLNPMGDCLMMPTGIIRLDPSYGLRVESDTEFNFSHENKDFAIYKNTSGTAFSFDAEEVEINGDFMWITSVTNSNNLVIGDDTNRSMTGTENTAVGTSALRVNSLGAQNVAIGTKALSGNTTGSENVAIGRNALGVNSTGGRNTAIGKSASFWNMTASGNFALGREALYNNRTGDANVAIGANALHTGQAIANNIAIGNSAGYHEAGSDKLYIDNQLRDVAVDHLESMIYGEFNADVLLQNLTFNANVTLNADTDKALLSRQPTVGGDPLAIATTQFVDSSLANMWVVAKPTPTSTGIKGQFYYEAGYKYECVETDTWTRFPVETTWS